MVADCIKEQRLRLLSWLKQERKIINERIDELEKVIKEGG